MAKTASKTKKDKQYNGTGRRKEACARVFITKGTGTITVNKKPMEEYFSRKDARIIVKQPLEVVDMNDKFDIYVTVEGGGIKGQAEAVRHGLTRALISYDEEFADKAAQQDSEVDISQNSYRRKLRKHGFVTRDSRCVERKKVGHRKARKVEQYSKR